MVDVLTAVNIVMSYIQFYKDSEEKADEAEQNLIEAKYGSRGTCIPFEFSDNSDGILYIPGCTPRPWYIPGAERKSAFVRTIAKFGFDNNYSSAYRKDEGLFWEIVKNEPKADIGDGVLVGGQDLIDICVGQYRAISDIALKANDSYKTAVNDRWTKVFATESLKTKIEQNLADENQIVNLDFYNDWLNGTLYFPLWQRRKKKKSSFIGIPIREKDNFCKYDKPYLVLYKILLIKLVVASPNLFW